MSGASEILSAVREIVTEYSAELLLFLLALLFVQTIRLWISRTAAARRMGRHKQLGSDGERRAKALLSKRGYRICAEQEGGSYRLIIDRTETPIHLRADYVVERKGRRFIAEVKSGAQSVKVTGRSTRRQLLEYLLAFDVAGVLLVDMHENQIHEVRFPELRNR